MPDRCTKQRHKHGSFYRTCFLCFSLFLFWFIWWYTYFQRIFLMSHFLLFSVFFFKRFSLSTLKFYSADMSMHIEQLAINMSQTSLKYTASAIWNQIRKFINILSNGDLNSIMTLQLAFSRDMNWQLTYDKVGYLLTFGR